MNDIHRRYEPKCNIYDNRKIYFGPYSERFLVMKDAIEHVLSKDKERKSGQDEMMAVDLACGPGVFTLAYAKAFPDLKWYPSELDQDKSSAFQAELIPTLDFLLKDPFEQFADRNGKAVYVGDSVILDGLENQEYNNQRGILTGLDNSKAAKERRFGVCLGENQSGKTISFKPSNILRDGKSMGETSSVNKDNPSQQFNHEAVLEGLKQRAFALDLLDPKSFATRLFANNLQEKCKLLTCSHVLSMIGYRAPQIWNLLMCLAHDALADGGFLIMFDGTDFGEYGNEAKMKAYLKESGLGLSAVEVPKKLVKRLKTIDARMKITIWKRDYSIRGKNPGW